VSVLSLRYQGCDAVLRLWEGKIFVVIQEIFNDLVGLELISLILINVGSSEIIAGWEVMDVEESADLGLKVAFNSSSVHHTFSFVCKQSHLCSVKFTLRAVEIAELHKPVSIRLLLVDNELFLPSFGLDFMHEVRSLGLEVTWFLSVDHSAHQSNCDKSHKHIFHHHV
jgi:hypothetical protein